jgi:hypothetical protein
MRLHQMFGATASLVQSGPSMAAETYHRRMDPEATQLHLMFAAAAAAAAAAAPLVHCYPFRSLETSI